MSSMDDPPPPPYSSRNHSPSLSSTPIPHNPLIQLRRYIIEIIGFSFNADFSLLNQALGPAASATSTSTSLATSILTADEHAELLNLTALIQNLQTKISDADTPWLTVRSSDREPIADAVIRPALYLGLPASYILELINTYASHQCDENKRSLTLISQRKPYFYSVFRDLYFLGPFNIPLAIFTNELWTHAHIIDIVAPNEEVRIVLANAMHVYQKQVLGIKKVMHIESVCECDAWKRLTKVLITEDEEDRIRWARWRRKREKAEEKWKRDSLSYSAST